MKVDSPIPAGSTSGNVTAARTPVHHPSASASGASAAHSATARFHTELDAAIRSAADELNLRPLMIDCLLRMPQVVGAAWFAGGSTPAQAYVQRLDNPALQQTAVRRWIQSVSKNAAQSRNEVIADCPTVHNLSMLAVPVGLPNGETDVIAFCITNPDPAALDRHWLLARATTRAVTQWYTQAELREYSSQLRSTAALLELTGKLESTRSIQQAARVLADEVRDHIGSDMAAVGLRRRGRITSRLTALSGLAEFDRNSSHARRITAALDEAMVGEQACMWPPQPDQPQQPALAGQKLATTLKYEFVYSIPLTDLDGNAVGALSVGGSAALNRPEVPRFISALDTPCGNALNVVRRAQPGLLRRVLDAPGSKSLAARLTIFALCGALLASLLMLPMPYKIACRCTCEAAQRVFSVAPYDGMLATTMVEPGDVVEEGQILAAMDDRELRYELAGLTAERHRAATERDVYMADREIAKSYMAALEEDRVHNRAQLLEHRLSNLEIRSPVAGVVLTGPTEKRENYPVEIGHLLYEIGPLDPIRLDVAIRAAEREHVEVGMEIEFRADHDVNDLLVGTIKRIRPQSEIVNDRNVFVAEVEFPNPEGRLRPGMEGSARIISKPKPLGWNLFHRAIDYIVQNILW